MSAAGWWNTRRLMARSAAWMSTVAALLVSVQLLAAKLPTSSLAPAVTVAALGVTLALWGERLSRAAPPLIWLPLLALGAYTVSEAGSGDGSLLAYVLPIIWVGCFFGRRHTALVVFAAAVGTALALTAVGARADPGVAWIESVLSLCGVAVLTTMLAESHRRNLTAREDEARLDPLTGLLNRRGLLERAALELARARRDPGPVSVIAFDIDHFKQINDTWGHDSGDRVLAWFADVLRCQVRTIDVVARTGGEEFVLLLPACGVRDARAVADRVRQEFSRAPAAGQVWATVSAGVTTEERPQELRQMLLTADRALYTAKAAGRDCTRVALAQEHEASHPAMVTA